MTKQKPKLEKIKRAQTGNDKLLVINYILLAAFVLFISYITTFKFFLDDDVFWHLATGRFILQNGYIPSADAFGFMTAGLKWIPFEWGWDVLTFLLFNIGGFYALSIFRTLIVIAIFSFITIILRKNDISFSIIIAFLLLLTFGLLSRLNVRPQLVTYLFLIIIIFIFYQYKYNYKDKKSFIVTLPLIFMIWANMHMGVLLGMLIFGLFIISEEIDYFFINKNKKNIEVKKKNKYLIYSFIFSIIALLINPHFIDTYIYTFHHTQMQMLEEINEWKSPLSMITVSNYYVCIYLFFIITGVIIVYYSIKKKYLFPILIYVVIGIYSLQAVRFISDFMIIIFTFWMLSLDFLIIKINVKKLFEGTAARIILIICMILLTISVANNTLYKKYLGNIFRETGFGINEKFFPKKMFDFITKENIDKIGYKPFNNLKIGGYFIWNFPEGKNFIDSRNLSDSIYSIYKNIDLRKYGFEALLENLEIDYVMYSTPYMVINASEIKMNIVSFLTTANDKWKLVYWDDRSFLFVKNLPKFQDLISRCEYKYISSYNLIFNKSYLNENYSKNRVVVMGELNRKLNEDPDGVIINDIALYLKRIH